jgi:hypothetical protein
MISTITNSTVEILTNAAITGTLALIGILVLISLLIQKELATAAAGNRLEKLNRVLNIGIVPLLIAFILIVAIKVADVLK